VARLRGEWREARGGGGRYGTRVKIARLALIALIAACALPAGAAADRAPTKAERAGIATAAKVPAGCLKIRVSTVNARYASTYRRNAKRGCKAYQADGVAVFKRRKSGSWKFVTAGSSFTCPVPHVPKRVAADLDIRCYDPGY
jgi:hypothetical protein